MIDPEKAENSSPKQLQFDVKKAYGRDGISPWGRDRRITLPGTVYPLPMPGHSIQ
jgi:hypothetical protein